VSNDAEWTTRSETTRRYRANATRVAKILTGEDEEDVVDSGKERPRSRPVGRAALRDGRNFLQSGGGKSPKAAAKRVVVSIMLAC
jgi:hypothetical protein